MHESLMVVHVLAAVGLVALVLLQQGKGADIGAAFGSGASQTLFGARGSANFLTRLTALLATVFFITSLTLAALAARGTAPESVTKTVPVEQTPAPVSVPGESKAPEEPAKPAPELPPVPR